jgi:hypothetical protein
VPLVSLGATLHAPHDEQRPGELEGLADGGTTRRGYGEDSIYFDHTSHPGEDNSRRVVAG